MISRTTPSELSISFVIREIAALFNPPRGGFQTPSSEIASRARTSSLDGPVASFKELGIPGVVNREGGSIVRIARI